MGLDGHRGRARQNLNKCLAVDDALDRARAILDRDDAFGFRQDIRHIRDPVIRVHREGVGEVHPLHRPHDRGRAHDLGAGHAIGETRDILIGRAQDQVLGCADLHDAALIHDGDAVGDLDGLVKVMGDEHNGLAELALQAQKFVLKIGAYKRIKRREGLVQKPDGGVGGERAGDADALLHTARHFAGIFLHGISEANHL